MKGATCAFHLVVVLVILISLMSGRQQAAAFVGRTCQPTWSLKRASTTFLTAEKVVEVCGFKDCRARGGGQRLQKLVSEVVEENGLTDQIAVEKCDCQGECGYGPNMVVDGKIVNGVRGREAILQALGINNSNE